MPDLSGPVADCITPPCYSGGQILEGLAYVVAAVLILVFILAVFTKGPGWQTLDRHEKL